MPRDLPTIETLNNLLLCDAKVGKLYWLERTPDMFTDGTGIYTAERNCKIWNTRYAGKEAFTTISRGYKTSSIFGPKYFAHRVIWTMYHGEQPSDYIDHKNHDRSDNRIKNLRVVTNQGNARNQPKRKDNTSGVTGVCWRKRQKKWEVNIVINGKFIYLGRFTDKADAIAARKAAEIEHGFHKNHGK